MMEDRGNRLKKLKIGRGAALSAAEKWGDARPCFREADFASGLLFEEHPVLGRPGRLEEAGDEGEIRVGAGDGEGIVDLGLSGPCRQHGERQAEHHNGCRHSSPPWPEAFKTRGSASAGFISLRANGFC